MTRAQRALACAIGFAPVTVAGIVLMRCHCTLAAYIIEVRNRDLLCRFHSGRAAMSKKLLRSVHALAICVTIRSSGVVKSARAYPRSAVLPARP
jgi:hypothetical protein